MIKGSRKYNLSQNITLKDHFFPHRMINGQGLGDVSRMRYGLCHMSFNGCEVISVYNALQYLDIPQPLHEVAFYMERYKVLLGIFGCSPYKLGKALEHFGAAFERLKEPGDEEAFIVSFWTKHRFLSSIHTVFCVRTPQGIRVYNRYNNYPDVQVCPDIESIIGKLRPIAVYAVRKKN